jgi:dipeptidyl aminopeptidase/acylaminoacyl peptidase
LITALARRALRVSAIAAIMAPELAFAGRPFQVDDLFRPEEIGSVAFGGAYSFSRDGRRLAMVRVRPWTDPVRRRGAIFQELERSDIWVQLAPSGPLTNLTVGAGDNSGSWAPQWSPDGSKLAFISTRGGQPGLWIWNSLDGSFREVAARGPLFGDGQPYAWLDDRRIVLAAQPARWDAAASEVEESLRTVERGWRQAMAGTEPTAEIVRDVVEAGEDGLPSASGEGASSELLLLDGDGQVARLASGISQLWRPSPTGGAVAWVAEEGAGNRSAALPFGVTGIGRNLPALQGPTPARVVQGCLSWSRDGTRLAVLGYDGSDRLGLYTVILASGRITAVPLADLWAGSCLSGGMSWSARQGVLFRAKRQADVRASSYQTARGDWWYVDARHNAVNLTQRMTDIPRRLFPAPGAESFIGAAAGKLWRITPERRAISNMTPSLPDPIRDIVWPAYFTSNDSGPVAGREYPEVVAALRSAPERFVSLDTATARSTTFGLAGRLVAFAPGSGSAIALASDAGALAMSRIDVRAGSAQPLFRANNYLQEIDPGRWQRLDYRSARGEALTGWLLLPPDYRQGRRYPLITWVYPERVYDASPPDGSSVESGGVFNMQVAAGRGFAVLFPSMPLGPYGVPEDPMARLQEGVLPALDAAIAAGLADPDRLFLMGHSFGGYAVNGLITQTARFRAAVALAGASDLTSAFGTASGETRYRDQHHDSSPVPLPDIIETGQFRMQSPPWRDRDRYVRNSPIYFVENVRTPLLLIHGDLDYVPIQQSEEFYSALTRLHRPVEFVRYLGEGHTPRSQANIRDMWRRLLGWFDRFGRIERDPNGAMIWEGATVRSARAE